MATGSETRERIIVDSPSYTPTGRELGIGCWGNVDEYTDPSGQMWAIKAVNKGEIAEGQSEDRRLSDEDYAKKETVPLSAARHHVVPRIPGRDNQGVRFFGMPVYEGETLGEVFGEEEDKKYWKKGFPLEKIFELGRNISDGLAYFHGALGRSYVDFNPENILGGEDGAFSITDLGASSILAPEERSQDPRDKIGNRHTMAYECFKEGSHPDERSDVFGFGALMTRALVGEYPNEGRLESAPNVGEAEADGRVEDLTKDLPKPLRNFLRSCLAYDPDKRPQGGVELEKAYHKAVKDYHNSLPRARLRRWGAIGAAASLTALATVGTIVGLDKNASLESQLEKETKKVLFAKRSKIVNDYYEVLNNKRAKSIRVHIEEGEIDGWRELFNDPNTALAAYLDHEAVYAAIQQAGGKTDWESVYPELLTTNINAAAVVGYLPIEKRDAVVDNIMHLAQREAKAEVKPKWAEAEKNWKSRKEKLPTKE